MPTSAEENASKQAKITKLREQVAAEQAKRTEREQGLTDQLVSDQLDSEVANLERQLAAAKGQSVKAPSTPVKEK